MALTAEEKAKNAEEKRLADEKEAANIEAESQRVQAELKAKEEAKAKAKAEAEGIKDSEKMFSETQVKAMMRQMMKEFKESNKENPDDVYDEDAYKQKQLRLPRFKNKFIVGFKNMNTDEYFPELVIHAFDVWNEQKRANEAWVTCLFEDDSEPLSVPLYTVLTKSTKVWVDIVGVPIEEDISYSTGRVEVAEVKDYSRQGTGTYVRQKVTLKKYTYKVKLPDGKEVIVDPCVVNW